ncbi:hypothetical protein [Thermococcus zilligii]|uniref:hypothetical protein n=1 Tax=Thermococcus zilligii TaxID=54076 RepID=UPI00029B2287|nr:hypothetical protein [Thermococcus zilligii]
MRTVSRVERLDYTGYSAEVLVCSLKDQTVKVEADVPEWIDSNAAFYITYSRLDYLGLLGEEIRKELVNRTSEGWKIGNFEFMEPDLKKVTYSKGTFTYAERLKKGSARCFLSKESSRRCLGVFTYATGRGFHFRKLRSPDSRAGCSLHKSPKAIRAGTPPS